jgi:serine/threonine protein kinase
MLPASLQSEAHSVSTSEAPPRSRRVRLPNERGQLFRAELVWRDLQPWLLDHGYQLRPRYAPNWKPSWEGSKKGFMDCEDGVASPVRDSRHSTAEIHAQEQIGIILDATRISDGRFVALKSISKGMCPDEPSLGLFFSTEPRASDVRNHCVPIYEVLQSPTDTDRSILVMPLLRLHDDPRFDTIGEGVEFLRQIFQGLSFMHFHQVAHRDIGKLNIMMDATPLFPKPYHPFKIHTTRDCSGTAKHYTRTQRPVKYWITDFGFSKRYDPGNGTPLDQPLLGADRTVPEYIASMETACNPFAVDVYCLGNFVRETFLEGSGETMLGFEFLRPLVADMVHSDPAKRPTMKEAMSRFEEIQKGLSTWKLHSRVVLQGDSSFLGFFRFLAHWWRRVGFMLRRVPALPTPATS